MKLENIWMCYKIISSESLKGKVKNIAKNKNLSSQEVLQMFFFERFLEKKDYLVQNINLIS